MIAGGQVDAAQRFIAPTVLNGVRADSPVMQEEIFGPILPIVHVDDLDAAIAHTNVRDKPLALYAFTNDRAVRERIVAQTSSGAAAFNVAGAHLSAPELPFGGAGGSGRGATTVSIPSPRSGMPKPCWASRRGPTL